MPEDKSGSREKLTPSFPIIQDKMPLGIRISCVECEELTAYCSGGAGLSGMAASCF